MWYSSFLRFKVLISIKILNSLLFSISNLRSFLLINIGLCRVYRFMIVLVLLEAINMLCKKVRGGNVVYKVDIHKAFETHSWNFLLLVLTHFRFHPSFFVCIRTILWSAMLSIRIKGSSLGFFPCSRGVRQNDPFISLAFLSCRGGSKQSHF